MDMNVMVDAFSMMTQDIVKTKPDRVERLVHTILSNSDIRAMTMTTDDIIHLVAMARLIDGALDSDKS